MLDINHCTFSYSRGKKPVIDDFSLRLKEGGVYGLLGSNGAGKSTLLYLMSGLLTPASGDVTLDGENVRLRRPSTLSEIFIVPEEFDFPSMRIEEYARLNGAFYPRFSMEELEANMAIFELDPTMNLGGMSMGQKKKAALCFAMACNTKVLLMDEPTNGLDIPGKSSFRRFIARAMTDDRIFLISTHQVRDVGQILDHLLIIDNRRVLFDKPVAVVEERMKFCDTNDASLIARALYAEKGMGGASVILPNTDGMDTELNLELLFNFAHENPEKLNSLFD